MMWLVVNHLLNTHNMVTTTLYLLKDKFRDLYKCKKKKKYDRIETRFTFWSLETLVLPNSYNVLLEWKCVRE